ncbi:MAG TPA: 2-C-methyl-D-erythritol 4-phosphate cytidylyltransferase, partial [Rhizomicrobium sp.]|nr:2-C-methyl-D-erythritol 4-phosphate cytidylyltransferase [Rhizomicrobium sp.]
MSRIAVLIVAAGKGERARLGQPNALGLPKQYERLAGQPMLRRTAQAFRAFDPACRIQLVIGAGQQDLAAAALAGLDLPAPVVGGATR